jgi:dihydroflavonol-4-reductase
MEPSPQFWAGKRVVVTGGTGFLGFHLVRQLLDLGGRPRVLALPPGPAHPLQQLPQVPAIFGDVRDPQLVRSALADCDVIFHTAGIVAVWGPALERMHSVHVEGTRNVLAAAPSGAAVVHTSSVVTVGATRTPEALTEDYPFNLGDIPVSYVHAKRAAEQLALEAAARGRRVLITNPGYLVGPDDHEHSVMGRFCVRFWKGRMPLVPPYGVNLVDVRDVARGHLLAAEHGRSGRRYILGGANEVFRDFLTLLADVMPARPRAMPTLPWWTLRVLAGLAEGQARLTGKEPYPSFQHAQLNRYYWFYHSDRAARELGYVSRPLIDCLADTYRWCDARGLLRLRGLNRWWLRPQRPAARAA